MTGFGGEPRTSIPLRYLISGFVLAPSGTGTTPLASSSTPVDVVSIKASPSNSVVINIGPSGSEMYPMSAGDSIDFEIVDLNMISISGTSVGNQRIIYIGGRQ